MKVYRYSRWDGSLEEFSLDADRALDAVGELLMQGLRVSEAMELMRRQGFELAGQDFRVMGVSELMRELRRRRQELMERYHMREATDSLRQRFEALLDREEAALRETHGYESRAMNAFKGRRHTSSSRLSEAIDKFRDYPFHAQGAQHEFDELAGEVDRLRQLEDFLERLGEAFRGAVSADYDIAQSVREQLEGIEHSLQALTSDLDAVDVDALRDLLGKDAVRSVVLLRDLDAGLRKRGYLRTVDGRDELTPLAIRRIGAQALASVYACLRQGRLGAHETSARGAALTRPDESRPYRFGDTFDLDVVRSVMNALRRGGPAEGAGSFQLSVEDLEVREQDRTTQTTTVLLLDLSWSMSFESRFPAAKRVALAMDQLIRTRFPRDSFFIVGFSTRARELRVADLPEVSWDPGDPFTNLQEGLMVAERLIVRHPNPSPQILVITDGQPTAYFTDAKELHVEWPTGYGGISPRAVAQTLKQVQRVTRRGITINTFMLHDSPELVGFVERMTEINRGRALFTDPARLGSYVMVDHLSRRRRTRL